MSNLPVKIYQTLSKQILDLQTSPPNGIRLLSDESEIMQIKAQIEGPITTPYENGIFKLILNIPEDFPANPPKGYFTTRIFHPNIAEKGEICVNALKKD